MPATRTLTFTPGPTIKRTARTLTGINEYSDSGVYNPFNRMQRPFYLFDLQVGPLTKQEVESLSALHALHQGGRSFFWDGGKYGTVEGFSIFGEADGQRAQYLLPNRYVGAGSLSIQSYRPSTGASSTWASGFIFSSPNAGLVTFTTVPVSGEDLLAKYACKYRVHFDPNEFVVEEIAAGLYTAQFRLIESGLTT